MNLFVANFDGEVTEGDLDELFGDYGKVTNARIWIDFKTGKSRGFGFVEMKDDSDAEEAIRGTGWQNVARQVPESYSSSQSEMIRP